MWSKLPKKTCILKKSHFLMRIGIDSHFYHICYKIDVPCYCILYPNFCGLKMIWERDNRDLTIVRDSYSVLPTTEITHFSFQVPPTIFIQSAWFNVTALAKRIATSSIKSYISIGLWSTTRKDNREKISWRYWNSTWWIWLILAFLQTLSNIKS